MKALSNGRKNNTGLPAQAGMSTLEILIAFTISILCIGAIILLTFGNQSMAVSLQTKSEAISLAQSILESARATSREDYSYVRNCEDGTTTPCTSTPESFYTTKLIIEEAYVTPCAENLKSVVTWNINDKTHSVDMLTHLVDILTAIALGGDCPSVSPTGNWSSASKLNSIDTNPTALKTTGLDVKNKIVYVSVDPSTATDSDFFIFDTNNTSATSAPIPTANINTGPGLEAVDVAGSYAYVANDSKNGQLQVIDISDIYNPILKTTLNVVPAGTDINTVGTKVFYYNKTLYLGLKKNAYAEFYVIDVSNPVNLTTANIKGSYEVNASINSISVKGDYAYLATPNNEELTVINVNPYSFQFMQRVGGFDAPAGSGNGKSVEIVGNKLYLGRTVGNTEFYILDITDPKNPDILGSYDADSSINDLIVSGNYAFLSTGESHLEFQILDISDFTNPLLVKKYNYTDKATGLDYEDNLIFLSSENGDALTIIKPEL